MITASWKGIEGIGKEAVGEAIMGMKIQKSSKKPSSSSEVVGSVRLLCSKDISNSDMVELRV
jgi:hypothetical protein